ncbi:MAG: hypothetical protein LBI44_07195 [Oscillospiraceae bacterium]|nr:hypothetical protein [Oscillospiraceae bacterium]
MVIPGSERFSRLRERYAEFIYHGFEQELMPSGVRAAFRFSVPGLAEFTPAWEFTLPENVPPKALPPALLFSLGLAELPSYWKAACPPVIRVECGTLTPKAVLFWKKLFRLGLGEFFYTNGIRPPDELVSFDFTSSPCPEYAKRELFTERALVPIGGGKDSVVSLELLRDKAEIYPYLINPIPAALRIAAEAGLGNRGVITRRVISPELLRLNSEGCLNGHTPFSAVVAFSSLISAYLTQSAYVVLSNEQSACEPTVAGTDINHQYSKSLDFERDFRAHEREHIGCGADYFSLLRPLTELQIARRFARVGRYVPIFRSCNAGGARDEWCGRCAKCLFVYIILSPFLPYGELAACFGKDMLADVSLGETLDKLTGTLDEKPFDCVGRRDETRLALRLLAARLADENIAPPALLARFLSSAVATRENESESELLGGFSDEHCIPERWLATAKEALL